MRTETQTGLDREIVDALSEVFAATPQVIEVVIFGSRAKGNFSAGSDIDLALKGKHLNLDILLDIRSRISQLGLLYKVDIHDRDSIGNKELLDHINRVGKVLWRRGGSQR